ncbi:hypothetical protein Xen7305DRAFT_00013920 [Xenococcus sp. PCC 7305]|uniref:sulfotransferase-like domain-containing protein n=1 Tax=Xenococcus sp. PCC 7305 TaxID=102125 RepID=UPI0002AC0299|nr:hypothetical protein [Xenococcus sp. PCC 7305]ELS01687.1 hypothetical protein Xen7305DRAFT_00013920 [Xenococcus sp. PCC 7305]
MNIDNNLKKNNEDLQKKTPSILALWAVPRSVSTAFVRMMIERDDFHVFNSSFSVYYYFSHDRVFDRYGVEADDSYDYQAVLSSLENTSTKKPLFLKDIAYYVKECMSKEFLSHFRNTFIIRDPKYALPSLYKIMPDFTLEETGYEQQYRMLQMVRESTGKVPVVIDGSELRANPEAVVKAYCQAVDIPFIPQALKWQPGKKFAQMELWKDWYDNVMNSSRFLPSQENKDDEIILNNKVVQDAYKHCLPFYQEMSKYRIQVK